jgi:hypothetical protein
VVAVAVVVMATRRGGIHCDGVKGGGGSSCQRDRKVVEVVMEA